MGSLLRGQTVSVTRTGKTCTTYCSRQFWDISWPSTLNHCFSTFTFLWQNHCPFYATPFWRKQPFLYEIAVLFKGVFIHIFSSKLQFAQLLSHFVRQNYFLVQSQTSDIQNKLFGPFQIFGSVRIIYCFMKKALLKSGGKRFFGLVYYNSRGGWWNVSIKLPERQRR